MKLNTSVHSITWHDITTRYHVMTSTLDIMA